MPTRFLSTYGRSQSDLTPAAWSSISVDAELLVDRVQEPLAAAGGAARVERRDQEADTRSRRIGQS